MGKEVTATVFFVNILKTTNFFAVLQLQSLLGLSTYRWRIHADDTQLGVVHLA